MKKTIVPFLALLMMSQVHAQVAHWIIHPNYDSIYFATGANLVITDSLNEKIVWTIEGKRLFETTDRLYPFMEDIAVVTEKDSDRITGFYSINGSFTTLENCYVAHNYPYFSDGYLVVRRGDKFYFVNTKGQLDEKGVVMAYPFHHGFASCRDYKNPDKPKDTYNYMINKEKQKQSFSFEGKEFSNSDLELISSVNDEGIGVIVAKHKAYYFKGKKELEPIFAAPEESDLKKQAKLNKKLSECLIELDNLDFVLYMDCGKSELDHFSCRFNSNMIPLEIGPNLDRIPFKSIRTTKEERTSVLSVSKNNGLFGFSMGNVTVLDPQFEAVYASFDNDAFVKTLGKHGLLRISKDENFQLSINDGKDIGFRHQTFNTTIRLDMPPFIPSEKTFVESLDTICFIDQIPKEFRNTLRGNYIQYSCMLDFPSNLTDKIKEISYPMQIVSDGIKFPIVKLKANAWHYKYITIKINESEKTINKGTATFTFDIIVERFSDDDVYPLIVRSAVDSSLYSECESLSSTHYKCTVYDLKEGPNNITIEILEKGCPPICFTHILTYNKPSAKNKHKESIDIKKKVENDEMDNEPSFEPTRPKSSQLNNEN